MLKTLTSTFAIALIAASSLGSLAHAAEGDYYEGISPKANRSIDLVQTGSVASTSYGFPATAEKIAFSGRNQTSRDNRFTNDSGDYYQGANRPN